MAAARAVLRAALALKPAEKAALIDKLVTSLDEPDREIDELWAREAERRIDAYEHRRLKAVSLEQVLEKHRRKQPRR